MASGPRIDQTTHGHFVGDIVDPTTNQPINPGDSALTEDEIAAIQAADAPDAGNPFATIADVGPGAALTVTDGDVTVEDVTTLEVSGATVSDEGGGVAGLAVSGGATPGAWITADFLFTEVAEPGTYTAELVIPPGGWLLDAFIIPETDVWASVGAVINVGDDDANGIFDAQGLDGGGTNAAYPVPTTSPAVGNNYASLVNNGGTGPYRKGAYSSREEAANGIGNAPGIPYPTGTTITMSVVTTDDTVVTPTGITRVRFIYTVPATDDATFVAA